MKLFLAAIFLVAGLGFCVPKTQAQVNFGTSTNQFTYTPVNGGTGGIVGVVIPNGGGTVVNVATGSAALPLQNIANTPGAQRLYLGDDTNQNVPLGFNFPYWGQTFNNSWMYSNGIVSFTSGNIPGSGCCGGMNLPDLAANGRNSVYNYMIAPMWTDLIDTTGNATWYKGTSTSMTYGWYGTKEYGTNNSNSFEVDINSSGAFNVRYGNAYVTNHVVTSGFTGDLSKGQYFQYHYGQGFNIPSTNPVSYGTTSPLGSVDQCSIDPLSSPSCPGYQAAYTTQQCTINPLYNPSCPGYAIAFHDQQCSINPLFMSDCPGYYQVYHDQQCSINPLYATDCPGYAAMYLQQQCSMNPLYSTTCPGYQQAYHDQQCSLNTLYASDCPGYTTAFRNYQFAQACSANPQSSPTCPGYVTPVVSTPTTTTSTATPTATQTATATAAAATATAIAAAQPQPATTTTLSTSAPPTTVSVSTSGTLTSPTQVAVIADPVVNNVITNNNTSAASTAAAPTAPAAASSNNQQAQTSPASPTPVAAAPAPASNTPPAAPAPAPQQARTTTTSKPTKEQADSMGSNAMKDSDKAGSMEQQKQIQNVVMGAMAYVPGFDVYNVALRDVAFYKPYAIYGSQRNVDNRNASRGLFGATDIKHNEMVNSQYQLGN
jgi:hypothetical protein